MNRQNQTNQDKIDNATWQTKEETLRKIDEYAKQYEQQRQQDQKDDSRPVDSKE